MINRTPNTHGKDGKPLNMQELFKRQNSTGLEQQNSTVKYDYQRELQTVGMRIRQRIDQGYQIPPNGQVQNANLINPGSNSPSLNPSCNIRDYASIIVPQFRSGSDLTPLFEETENANTAFDSTNTMNNNNNSNYGNTNTTNDYKNQSNNRNSNSYINNNNEDDEDDEEELRRKRRV